MKIEIVERGSYKASQRFKKIVTDKLTKLDRYFDEDASAKVVCLKQDKKEKLEITIKSKGFLYRSEVISPNMYDNIDLALPKLEAQIVRARDKKKDKSKRRAAIKDMTVTPFEFLQEEPEELPEVFKKKTFELEPMTADAARFAIERLGHDFYIFLNARTGRVNVLYRRHDGKFGLIDVKF